MTGDPRFFLRSPRTDDLLRIQAWMQSPSVHAWFDFGQGRQQISTTALNVMARSAHYCMRVFGEQGQDAPLGVAVLSDVLHPFGTAHFWVVRDQQQPAYAGITAEATRALLHLGFHTLARRSINAWVVESNTRSLRLLASVGFQRFGTQQACHCIDGRVLSRIHLELLPEHFYQPPSAMQTPVA